MQAVDTFSQSYAEARAKFLQAADDAGLAVESHVHPMRGRDDEQLAMDVVRDGPADADKLLLISSACHGVEGFCGSGVQVAMLRDATWRAECRDAGVAVLHVHALNPYGFSWWRRTTHENVDLNRNFRDFSQPLPANPAYGEIAALLVPPTWPPSDAVKAQVQQFIAERGMPALQAAVSGGQHDHPEGLYFAGRNPTWSNRTLRQVLRDHARRCTRLGWIDLHTGLGPRGHGERIYAGPDEAAEVARARAWWGDEVTSIYDGSSSSSFISGMLWGAAPQECPQAQTTSIALEFGTIPTPEVIDALRAEQWLENHPEAPADQRLAIKQQLREAFYIDADDWKQQILAQSFAAAREGVAGLVSR